MWFYIGCNSSPVKFSFASDIVKVANILSKKSQLYTDKVILRVNQQGNIYFNHWMDSHNKTRQELKMPFPSSPLGGGGGFKVQCQIQMLRRWGGGEGGGFVSIFITCQHVGLCTIFLLSVAPLPRLISHLLIFLLRIYFQIFWMAMCLEVSS